MAKKKKKVPGINGSSTADISFILLLFFLLTTSMGSDKGISRQLPPAVPPDQQDVSIDVNKRNMLRVMVNNRGQILANGEEVTLDGLLEKVKEFVLNSENRDNLPELSAETFPIIGTQMVTKNHVISLTNNVDTRYEDYIAVQDILTRGYMELREEAARKFFGASFADLCRASRSTCGPLSAKDLRSEPRDYSSK